jgi:hypothetical protein
MQDQYTNMHVCVKLQPLHIKIQEIQWEQYTILQVPVGAASEDHLKLLTTMYIFQVQEAARTTKW